MTWSVALSALCLAAAAALSPSAAFAFETVTSDNYPFAVLSTKLPDADNIVQDMAQRYSGNRATIYHSGGMTIGIVGSGSGAYTGESTFAIDPAAGIALSKGRR